MFGNGRFTKEELRGDVIELEDGLAAEQASMIQEDMGAYIYPASFGNDSFRDLYDEF